MSGTDLVVVLPGIMGSTLYDKDNSPIWEPSAGALMRAIGSLGKRVKRLRLPPDIGDEPAPDGVTPRALMPDVHGLPGIWTPIKGYDPLVKRLNSLGYHEASKEAGSSPGNLLLVPYDWRLSTRYNAQRLAGIVEPALHRWRSRGGQYTDAQLVFVCHSLGGLVARWYIEMCGGADITRRLITLGTPYRGSAKAVEQLVNGVRKGLGPLGVNLTDLARSLPSTYQLLPEYACIENGQDLVKTTESDLPDLPTELVTDAMRFQQDLQDAEGARPASLDMAHAVVGTRQPTWTTIRIDSQSRAVPISTINRTNHYGDGTVPLVGGIGYGLTMGTNRIHRIAEQHGNLQRNKAVLDEIEEILTTEDIRYMAEPGAPVSLETPDYVTVGEPIEVTVSLPERHAVRISVVNENGKVVDARVPKLGPPDVATDFAASIHARFEDLPPDAYSINVTAIAPGSPLAPVAADVLVVDATT
jgi:hypothetical protein